MGIDCAAASVTAARAEMAGSSSRSPWVSCSWANQ